MIAEVESKIKAYTNACEVSHRHPTPQGLADILGVCEKTIYRVLAGEYATDRPYTDKPHPNRAIDNKYFTEVSQALKGVESG